MVKMNSGRIAIGVVVGPVCFILARDFRLPVRKDLPELK